MSNPTSTSSNRQRTTPVAECRARAQAYLAKLVGVGPATLTWDSTHCLQGHVHVGHHELVVIASRDARHAPVVLTAPNWDAVRRCANDERHELIESCAITDHAMLASALVCS